MISNASQDSRLKAPPAPAQFRNPTRSESGQAETKEQTIGFCQSSESRSRSVSRCIPRNPAVVHRHWGRGLASGQYSWGQNFMHYYVQQVRIIELMARWFSTRGRLRGLRPLE